MYTKRINILPGSDNMRKFVIAMFGIITLTLTTNGEIQKNMPYQKDITLYASFEKSSQPEINKSGIPIKWSSRTGIKAREGITGKGAMELDLEGYGEIDKGVIDVKSGTIAFWFNPKGDPTGDQHTYLSWGWKKSKYPYFVFSQPWFNGDPGAGGPDKTYYVFYNKIRSVTAFKTSLRKGEWVFYAVTWKKDVNGKMIIAAFQNGKEVASKLSNKPLPNIDIETPLFLGCDKGTARGKGCWMDGFINDFVVYKRALGKKEIKALFNFRYENNPALKGKIVNSESWLDEMKGKPYIENRDKNGTLLESRMIFDDDGYVFDERLKSAKKAGFNVYMSMVWKGYGLECESDLIKKTDKYIKYKKKKSLSDPYKNFIDGAHRQGMEVHSSFTISLASSRIIIYPEYYLKGTRFYNGYDPKFRDFIVGMILEHVKRYNIDGINLDFVRIQTGLDTVVAAQEYKRIYGKDLSEDRKNSTRMAEFTSYCVDDIVKRVSAGVRKLKPEIIVSVCAHVHPKRWGLPSNGRNIAKWVEKGWIDVAYNMDYEKILSIKLMDEGRSESSKPYAFVELVGNYDFIGGKCTPRIPEILAKQIDYCRKKYNDGNGIGLYLSRMLSNAQVDALRKGPFKESAKPSWRK